MSGYTATGSTVFGSHNLIADQGAGILMYRQFTQWIGGMGIVVLVVTVLPSLRASGLGLIDGTRRTDLHLRRRQAMVELCPVQLLLRNGDLIPLSEHIDVKLGHLEDERRLYIECARP